LEEILMKKLIIKKCSKCGTIAEIWQNGNRKNCDILCCGQSMKTLEANTSDGAIEKHKPIVELVGNYIIVSVNHVMQPEHYIEWIALESSKTYGKKSFIAGDKAVAVFPYVKGSTVYAYCNQHGLWSTVVTK
jgi:superoxide reductase